MAPESRSLQLVRGADYWIGRFSAMASPCEVLIEDDDERIARDVLTTVSGCAWRIEDKYSRYRDDNIIHAINSGNGKPVIVDEETADLLDFSARLFDLSGGLFDITSGVLRRAWRFDGGRHVPDESSLRELMQLVGWQQASWQRPVLTLRAGMQVDFGGFGKEYAVDQAAGVAGSLTAGSCLVNFGGDLAVTRPRRNEAAWQVGIEAATPAGPSAVSLNELFTGALATSGDTHRFVMHDGRRYSHILDPRTGWPVKDAPRCVTVAADTCTQAGMFTTLAMLQGAEAANFLRTEGLRCWIQH